MNLSAHIRRRPAAWSAPEFPRLTRAWVFTNLGDSALYLMAAVWVKDLTGSDVAAAFVFVSLGVPAVAAPFLGMLADRVPRTPLLVWTNLTMVVVLPTLFAVQSPDQVGIVYAVMLLYSSAGYLTGAAQSGLLRGMLRDDQLASGNGLLSTVDNGFRLLSPLIGTALYVRIGPAAVVTLTAACFATTAVILSGLTVGRTMPTRRMQPTGYWQELVAGFVQLFQTPGLGLLTLALAIAFGATGLLNIVVFPALDTLGVEPAALGVLTPLQGAGAVVGGLLSAWLVTRLGEGPAAAIGLVLVAAGTVPLVGTSVVLVGAGLLAVGLGIPIAVVAFVTLRQRSTPDELQGRASAAGNAAINLPQTLVSIVGASVLVVVDYRWLIWIAVAAVLIGAGFALAARIVRPDAARPARSLDRS